MLRSFAVPLAFLLLALPLAKAQDAIPPETLAAVKHATVFIQVSGPNWKASGTGFVVSVDKDTVLIATNHHVISLPENDKKNRLSPSELSKSLKMVNITVVFDSGTKTEVSMKAEPLAADPDIDLAVLRVTKVKDPPKPIDYAAQPKLSETMQVFSFGFPFGEALSTSKGSPAITVGKASISSLRNDDDGELRRVQLDGALNPGNSGGPVVDSRGQLVGVAVATIRGGQGIGLAIPGAELGKIMKGRLGAVQAGTVLVAGKRTTKVEVEIVDPSAAVKEVKLYYVVVPLKGTAPAKGTPLDKHPNAKSIVLKPTGDLAAGELAIDPVDGDLFIQAIPQGGLAEKGATPIRNYAMTAARGVTGQPTDGGPAVNINVPAIGAKPPEGWKEHVPRDKTYVVWVPMKSLGQSERERTQTTNGLRLKFNTLFVDVAKSQQFTVAEILVTGAGLITKADGEAILKNILVEGSRGRLIDTQDVRMGTNSGKEHRVETTTGQIRARVFVVQNRLVLITAEGPKAFVEGEASGTFLDSCRLTVGNLNAPPKVGPGPGPGPGPFVGPGPGPAPLPAQDPNSARKSTIIGAFNDPVFTEDGPAGGYLIGLEVGFGTDPFKRSVIQSARPIYKVGENETPGNWHGPVVGRQVQKIMAKPGYAVGGFKIKPEWGFHGISVIFIKVVNGKLELTDSYESPWLGTQAGNLPANTVTTDGRMVVGIIGRKKEDSLMGLGLLYADQPQLVGPMPVVPKVGPTNPLPPPSTTPEIPTRPPVVTPPSPPKSTDLPQPVMKAGTDTSKDDDEPKEKKSSNLPIILAAGAGVLFLILAIVGVVVLVNKGGEKPSGKRNRGRDRDSGRGRKDRYDDADDDDDDDDDRPRRRRR